MRDRGEGQEGHERRRTCRRRRQRVSGAYRLLARGIDALDQVILCEIALVRHSVGAPIVWLLRGSCWLPPHQHSRIYPPLRFGSTSGELSRNPVSVMNPSLMMGVPKAGAINRLATGLIRQGITNVIGSPRRHVAPSNGHYRASGGTPGRGGMMAGDRGIVWVSTALPGRVRGGCG